MAPVWTPTRAQVLQALADRGDGALPASFGRGEVEAVVQKEGDGRYRLRLVECVDPEGMARDRDEALRAGRPWMPEHAARFFGPKTVLLDVATREELIAALEGARWQASPREA